MFSKAWLHNLTKIMFWENFFAHVNASKKQNQHQMIEGIAVVYVRESREKHVPVSIEWITLVMKLLFGNY